jgi:hypothetical protein
MTIFSFLHLVRKDAKASRRLGKARKVTLRLEALEDRRVLNCTSISGYVYVDANNNGLFDAGEKPLANNQVQLQDLSGNVIATATTDANGFYNFDHDPRINTTATTLTRTLDFNSATTDWTRTGAIAQFDPSLGTLTSVDIVSNDSLTSQIRVENLDHTAQKLTGVISGAVTLSVSGVPALVSNLSASEAFNATSYDGKQDFAGGSGKDFGPKVATGNKTVTLTDAKSLSLFTGTGNVSVAANAHTTSMATGAANLLTLITSTADAHVTVVYHYTPENCLPAGMYKVVQLKQPAGYLDGKESHQGIIIPGSVGTDFIGVILNANGNSVHNDFGEVPPACVSGFVYLDSNNNGVKDAGERGIGGATITLTGVNDLGKVIYLNTTTKADGSYQFNDLRPGTYTVVESTPAGYIDGKDQAGSAGGTVGNDLITMIHLNPGCNTGYNFGEMLPGCVGGFAYIDDNNDGNFGADELAIPGTTIILSGTDDLGHAVVAAAVTGMDGSYEFDNLRPGIYQVHELQPRGFLDGKDTLGSLGGAKANDVFWVAINSGQCGNNYNFGEILPPPPPNIVPTLPPSKWWFIH